MRMKLNEYPDVSIMIVGEAVGTWYLYMVYAGGMAPWWGIDHLRFGIIGALASLIAMVAVTLMTPAPDQATQDMVDQIRIPKGQTILGASH